MGKEFLAGFFAWLAFIVPVCIHLMSKRMREDGEYNKVVERVKEREVVSTKVQRILKRCMDDLTRQNAAAFGPWIPSLMDGGNNFYISYDSRGRVHVERQHRDVPPSVALTAVKRTIEDLLSAPLSYDKDGREMPRRRLDLGTLLLAERELLEMGA